MKRIKDIIQSIKFHGYDYFIFKFMYFPERMKQKFGQFSILLWPIIVGAIIYIIIFLYQFDVSGFGDYVSPNGDFQRRKTLWDWLNLLIVPLIIAIGSIYINKSLKTRDEIAMRTKEQNDTLQFYFDKVSDILTSTIQEGQEEVLSDLLDARTHTILDQLDGKRKGYVFKFLNNAQLIIRDEPVISLFKANLSSILLDMELVNDCSSNGANFECSSCQHTNFDNLLSQTSSFRCSNLRFAKFFRSNLQYTTFENAFLYHAEFNECDLGICNFSEANLRGSYFLESRVFRANFSKANLIKSTLTKSDFSDSNFSDAKLNKVDFSFSNLKNVDFSGASLNNVVFDYANLKDAKISDRQMSRVKSMKETILPDGSKSDEI